MTDHPLIAAMDELGARVGLTLDGRPAPIGELVAQANDVRRVRGEAPIAYPIVEPLWKRRGENAQ